MEPVRVVLWWVEQPDGPQRIGKLSRVQVERERHTVTLTRPHEVPSLEARYMDGDELSAALYGLKLYGLGVFALAGPHEDHPLSRTCDVCHMPIAAVRDMVDRLRGAGWC